jgi:hypothetical protein
MARLKRHVEKRDGARRLELFKLPDNLHVAVKFLANAVWLPTHYHPGGSIYCFGAGKCLASAHRSRVIWKGYSPVQVWHPTTKRWVSFVFEVTEELGRRFGRRSLRGEIWLIHRDGKKSEQAPIVGELSEELPAEVVSDAFSIEGVLYDLYRVHDPETHDFPPLPERLYLPELEGPAPKGLAGDGRYR